MKDKEQWLKQFDETKDTFKWVFIEYGFQPMWEKILIARQEQRMDRMLDAMSHVWFALPDSEFNILVSPPGWKEFLQLIET